MSSIARIIAVILFTDSSPLGAETQELFLRQAQEPPWEEALRLSGFSPLNWAKTPQMIHLFMCKGTQPVYRWRRLETHMTNGTLQVPSGKPPVGKRLTVVCFGICTRCRVRPAGPL